MSEKVNSSPPSSIVPFIVLSFLLSILIGCLVEVSAQPATATLTGRISDENLSVIPDVEVILTNDKNGKKLKTTTSRSGDYYLDAIQPGAYKLDALHQKFAPANIDNIELHVGDFRSQNITLKIPRIDISVNIEGRSLFLKREDASVGTLFDRQLIDNLPMNGRSFHDILGLSSGVVRATPRYDENSMSINGQRFSTNYYYVDGVSANIGVNPNSITIQALTGSGGTTTALGTTANLVSLEAMEEFKVVTSTFSPEYGRTPGAQITIITRSGTNEFHGSIFEYLRNDALDANDWFSNALQYKKAALRQNNFGGVLGGYLVKNHSFFFLSYEGSRLLLPEYSTSTVPSIEVRQLVPATLRPIINAHPIPNGKYLGGNFSEFNSAHSNKMSLDATSMRIDQVVNSKIAIFGRYSYTPSLKSQRGPLHNFVQYSLSNLSQTKIRTQSLTIGVTNQFASSVTNDFRINYGHNHGKTGYSLDNYDGAIPFDPVIVFPESISSQNGTFKFNLSSFITTNLGALRIGSNRQIQRQFNIIDSLSIQNNSHLVKIGIDYRRLSPIRDEGIYYQEVYIDGDTEVMNGKSVAGYVAAISGPQNPIFNNLSIFAQDTWKVSPKLSATFGLRWELNPPPKEKNGKDPAAITIVENPLSIDLAPNGTPLYRTRFNNFAPRIGIAYVLNRSKEHSTIVRGGFGKFYDVGYSHITFAFRPQYTFAPEIHDAEFPFNPELVKRPNESVAGFVPIVFGIDPNYKLPRSYHWNIALEHSLSYSQTLSISYVASLGRELSRQEYFRNINNRFYRIFLIRNNGSSDYNSLQIAYQRPMIHNLQVMASYNWSHSLDNTSSDVDPTRPLNKTSTFAERASSSYDIRHAFNLAIVYDVKNPRINKFIDGIVKDWSMSSIFVTRTALPVNINIGLYQIDGLRSARIDYRPDLIPGIPLYISDSSAPGGKRINRNAFVEPPDDRQGTLGRNALRGFSMWQWDYALYRSFSIKEQLKLRVGAEIFNILNHPNFADPGTGSNLLNNLLSYPEFGRSTSMLNGALSTSSNSSPNKLYGLGGPRSIQFSLKLSF